MLSEPKEEVQKRAKTLLRALRNRKLPADIEIRPCESQIGGGSLPLERIPSMAVTIRPEKISVNDLEERMRHLPVPIIPRTVNDEILLDVRTISDKDVKIIADQLKELDVLEKTGLIEK